MLRSGRASPRFQAVVADLIDKGGFNPTTKFGAYEDIVVFHDKRLIEKILLRDYPDRSPKSRLLMATHIMAIMLLPSYKDPHLSDLDRVSKQAWIVQRAVKLRKDKRRQALALIGWRITTEPCTLD